MGSTDAGGVSFLSLGAENYTSYKNGLDAKGTNIKLHQLRKVINDHAFKMLGVYTNV